MKKLAYISLCVMVSSCASKQMRSSIESLEKQNQSLRSDVARLQDKINGLSNDMLVVQSRVENHPSVVQSSPQSTSPTVVVPSASPAKPSLILQNSFFGDDIKFSDEEPSLKFTNKDLSNTVVQQTVSVPKQMPAPASKPKGTFTDSTVSPAPPVTTAAIPSQAALRQDGIEDPAIVAAYNKAYKKFKEQNYKVTIGLMGEFLKKYPSHPYSDNAVFWMGESYFQLKNYEKANRDFERVIQQYPNGNKVPDALLRSGICKLRLSEPQKAKISFDQLIAKYPESMAAKRAKATLGEI